MAEESEIEETEEVETEEVESLEDDDDNWGRLGKLIDERLEAWQAKQKTTSSSSQRKRAAPTPKRKTGFLTKGFFDPPGK